MATARSIPKRTLIVTGASSGIGRELARRGATLGFNIVATARRKERLEALATELTASGGACAIVVGDVTQAATAQRIVDTAMAQFGRIDVLIHNAGMGAPGGLLDQSDAAIDLQWQTHVHAPLRITRLALEALRASGGQVFFIGSGVARVPVPGFGAYCAAKAAMRAAAMQLRRELRGSGIAITYVDPGAVDTEFSEAAGMKRSPSAMLARPDSVAARILAAVDTRPATVAGVPVQAVAIALGEAFPLLADLAMNRIIDKPATPTPDAAPAEPALTPPPIAAVERSTFVQALEPVARRIERAKLSPDFLAGLLVPQDELHLTDVAMRWAGMPNKNERAAMAEALEALAAGGFLQKTGDETWRVLHSAE